MSQQPPAAPFRSTRAAAFVNWGVYIEIVEAQRRMHSILSYGQNWYDAMWRARMRVSNCIRLGNRIGMFKKERETAYCTLARTSQKWYKQSEIQYRPKTSAPPHKNRVTTNCICEVTHKGKGTRGKSCGKFQNMLNIETQKSCDVPQQKIVCQPISRELTQCRMNPMQIKEVAFSPWDLRLIHFKLSPPLENVVGCRKKKNDFGKGLNMPSACCTPNRFMHTKCLWK